MTDDFNLTPGGASPTLTVKIRGGAEGNWVEWTKDGETGRLGPYLDAEMAENVRSAKERELKENSGHIDNAEAGKPNTTNHLL